MSEETPFADLIGRVRAGDGAAAAELVRRYEPAVRRTIRARLRDSRLRRRLDSLDVCQSVLASFFVRAALGRWELDRPEQLLQLLAVLVKHKLLNEVEKHQAGRRDYRRVEAAPIEERDFRSPESTPSRQVAARELLAEALRRLSPDERQLLDWREQGRPWADIAGDLGGSPEALRKRLQRALDRVADELGLEA